jgi:mannose-6-phosphate isomerase-like protein (cupin superfamily)
VRFTVGQENIEAGPGDIVVAGQEIPHKFKNIGTEQLEIIGIHPSPRIIQELIEE